MDDPNRPWSDNQRKPEDDELAIGQGADGVVSLTPEEAAKLIGQRNANEAAFGAMMDDDLDDEPEPGDDSE